MNFFANNLSRFQGSQSAVLRRDILVAGFALLCGLGFILYRPLGFALLLAPFAVVFSMRYLLTFWKIMLLCVFLIFTYVGNPVSHIMTWGMMLLFLISFWKEHYCCGRPIEWGDAKLWMSITGWFAWGIVSTVYSMNPVESIKELIRYAFSFVFLLTYFNWLNGLAKIKGAVRWFEGIIVVISILCVVEGLTWIIMGEVGLQKLVDVALPSKIKGPYPPTFADYGAILAAVIPLSMACLLAPLMRWSWPRFFAVGLMWLGLVMTTSRASVVAALVGALVLLIMVVSPGMRRRILMIGFLLGALFLVVMQVKYGDVSTGIIHNLSGRDLLWSAAMKAVQEQPLLGVGPGCWSVWLPERFFSVDFMLGDLKGNNFWLTPSLLGGEAHNLFLTKAAEMGIPSLAWLVCIFGSWFFSAGHVIRKLPAGYFRAVAIGSYASIGGLFVRCLFENGPIIGKGRGFEVLMVWFVFVLPFVIHKAARLSPQAGPEQIPKENTR